MRRREFLRIVAGGAAIGAIGCAGEWDSERAPPPGDAGNAPPPPEEGPDAAAGPIDAAAPCDGGFATMHDTHAQALYLDGSLGPLTGIVYVDYVVANVEIQLDFWHGHGGQLHRFTLTPVEFAALKRGERVYVTTTIVEDHQHQLFIDPIDPDYRVEGAPDVLVALPCE